MDLVRENSDPTSAAKFLVDHALSNFSTDNLSCLIVRLDKDAILEAQNNRENPIGVEGDGSFGAHKVSETDKIVGSTKAKITEGGTAAVGVSASNSGRGYDPIPIEDGADASFKPTTIEGPVEEEPTSLEDSDAPEVSSDAIPDPQALKLSTPTSPTEAGPTNS